ncbi:hypothetical protein AAC387_Pa07g0281 [Persea americana]
MCSSSITINNREFRVRSSDAHISYFLLPSLLLSRFGVSLALTCFPKRSSVSRVSPAYRCLYILATNICILFVAAFVSCIVIGCGVLTYFGIGLDSS